MRRRRVRPGLDGSARGGSRSTWCVHGGGQWARGEPGSSRGLPGTGDLVYGLASGGRGGGRWSARDGPGRRHARQPGDRLFIGCPFGGSAAWIATTGGGGPLSATARRDCRLRPRCSLLRRGYRGGGRYGASRRGAAARTHGVAGAWGGPLFWVRTAGRRAADRRGGRRRRRVSGRDRRPAGPGG